MSLEDTHVNILFSKSLEGLIDKDMILNRHIVPLLASRDKILYTQRSPLLC